jgi:predicted Rossmann-fold nucleotide-binding protein
MICFGRSYWNGLLKWANGTLKRGKYISPDDPNLVTVTDSPVKAIQIINEYHNRTGHQTSPPPAYA